MSLCMILVVLLLPYLAVSLSDPSVYKFNTLRELQRAKFSYLSELASAESREQDLQINIGSITQKRLTNFRLVRVVGLGEKFRDVFFTRTIVEPKFLQRFIGEVFLAIALQGIAEYQRRGKAFLAEIDYVFAGILTAVLGKGIAAFRSAPSVGAGTLTNAFQLGDYTTLQRFLSFLIIPAPKLFISGAIAGGLGYSLSRFLTFLRLEIFKVGAAAAPVVPIVPAAIYTGCFLVFVSGPSYQILSGLIEQRTLDRVFKNDTINLFIVAVMRILRSLLASALAIRGMQMVGLQKTL